MPDLIHNFFSQDVQLAKEQLAQVQSAVGPNATVARDKHFDSISKIMTRVVDACTAIDAQIEDPSLRDEVRSRFQKELCPSFAQGWLGLRGLQKPRGYAGDYLLLTGIYDYGPIQAGFGGYTDLWLVDMLLAKAIRSRWQGIREFLTTELSNREGDVSVLNVASGPAREFAQPLKPTSNCNIHLQCLDNDQESLDYVAENVVSSSGIDSFKLNRCNALRLKSSSSTIRAYGKFDVIYSIGLFDYIDDERLIPILSGLRECLNEDGVIYLNFKDTERYNEFEYQWLLDWHFFQRTEQDCLDLFEKAGFTMSRMEPTTRDDTGVIINFVNRVAPATIRIDGAHELESPTRVRKPAFRSKKANAPQPHDDES